MASKFTMKYVTLLSISPAAKSKVPIYSELRVKNVGNLDMSACYERSDKILYIRTSTIFSIHSRIRSCTFPD